MTGGSQHDRTLAEELAGLEHGPELLKQAAALAWLPRGSQRTFVVVTSRRTGRWVFPKGNIDPGMTPAEAAAQEAQEEAGVVGLAKRRRIGRFRTVKIRPPTYWDVEVELYPVKIDRVLDDWLEMGQRDRRFVTLEEAKDLLTDPAMVKLAARFLARGE